jgi:hypothetical protein
MDRGILLSLGKHPRSVVQFTNFFVERVDKPTDNKPPRGALPLRLTLIRAPNGRQSVVLAPARDFSGRRSQRPFL